MRRDVYIENDSGGFSVLAADAVDAIIEDGRSDDMRFVSSHKALLLELYGDDSMPVRIVVDEPLRPDEESQWLARASWRIETSDGGMLVMGGFDPDVLSSWKEAGGAGDGRGVGAFSAAPGGWQVDVYAHVGSMNGRVILSETEEKPGAAFRRSHPGRAFPLWLAKMLEFSGEDDPGFEELWTDVRGSMTAGQLAVDTGGGDAIGFLVHVTRASAPPGEPPEGIWFDRAANSRVPATFPLGIPSDVPDPDLRSFHDKLLDIRHPEPERPIAEKFVGIIESWPGDPLKPIDGGPVAIPPGELFLLHWMAAFTSDSTPRFELWVEPKAGQPWAPPAATPDFAVIAKSSSVTAVGPVENTGGWHTWSASRSVATAVRDIPDGSTIDLAMAADLDEDDDDQDPAVGRAQYSGRMSGGQWHIAEASPAVARDALEQALAFTRDVAFSARLQVRDGREREAFDAEAREFESMMGGVHWEGDVLHLADHNERMMLLLAAPVFRARFGDQWAVSKDEDDGEES